MKASAQLFFDAFENENIGIYGHTGGEQETGNGGQGEGNGDVFEDGEIEQDVKRS